MYAKWSIDYEDREMKGGVLSMGNSVIREQAQDISVPIYITLQINPYERLITLYLTVKSRLFFRHRC